MALSDSGELRDDAATSDPSGLPGTAVPGAIVPDGSEPANAWEAPTQSRTGRTFGSLIDRMNRWLVPYIGPPPLGPYNEAPRPIASACPLCGSPMAEHTINRDAPRTQLHCPA